MAENIETISSSEWIDTEIVREKPTFWSRAVFFMICLIAIFANIAFGGVSSGILGIISLLIGLLAIFWILDSWKNRGITFSTSTIQLPILGLILIGLIQLLPLNNLEIADGLLSSPAVNSLSLDPYSTRFAIIKFFIYLIFFAACLTFINNQQRLRKIVVTIIAFASIMSFYGVLQSLANFDSIYGIRKVEQAIPFASYVNQHHFAAFLEMTIGLTLGLLFGRATESNKFPLLIITVLLMGIGIIFTGSRGGFLSLLGVIGFLLLINLFNRKGLVENTEDNEESLKPNILMNRLGLIGGSVVLVLILLVSVMWLDGSGSVLRGTGIQVNQNDFTSGRTHFWNTASQIIRDNPILGTGFESFGVAFTKYDKWNGTLRIEQAHNDYLQILSDAGILGLLCIVIFVVLLFRQSFTIINNTSDPFRRNVAIGALAGCFGILIHSFFDFPLRTNANMFFFLIMVTLAVVPLNYPQIYRKRIKVEQKKIEGDNQKSLEEKKVIKELRNM